MSQKCFKNRNIAAKFSAKQLQKQQSYLLNDTQERISRKECLELRTFTQSDETIYSEAENQYTSAEYETEGTLQHSFRKIDGPVIAQIQMQDTKRSFTMARGANLNANSSPYEQIKVIDLSSSHTSASLHQRDAFRKIPDQKQVEMSFGYQNSLENNTDLDENESIASNSFGPQYHRSSDTGQNSTTGDDTVYFGYDSIQTQSVLRTVDSDREDFYNGHDSKSLHQTACSRRSDLPQSQFESNSGFRVSFYSFLKELRKIGDPFLNFELKIALDHYSDRDEYKQKLIDFFYRKNLVNASYHRNLLPWRRCQNYWLVNYVSKSPIQAISNFGSGKLKKSFQYSWMSTSDASRKRTKFCMLNNRQRKVLIQVKTLSQDTSNIHPEFIQSKHIHQTREFKRQQTLRPCLFFFNPKFKAFNYFDLCLRKNVQQIKILGNHTRLMSQMDGVCFSNQNVFLRQGADVNQINLTNYKEEKYFDVQEELLSFYHAKDYLVLIPKRGNFILYLNLLTQKYFKSVFGAIEGKSPNIFLLLRPLPQCWLFQA